MILSQVSGKDRRSCAPMDHGRERHEITTQLKPTSLAPCRQVSRALSLQVCRSDSWGQGKCARASWDSVEWHDGWLGQKAPDDQGSRSRLSCRVASLPASRNRLNISPDWCSSRGRIMAAKPAT